MADIFTRLDVDFENSPLFSKKFHLVTTDKQSLVDFLGSKQLDELAAFPNLEWEFEEKRCLFRTSRTPISPAEASDLLEATLIISRLLS